MSLSTRQRGGRGEGDGPSLSGGGRRGDARELRLRQGAAPARGRRRRRAESSEPVVVPASDEREVAAVDLVGLQDRDVRRRTVALSPPCRTCGTPATAASAAGASPAATTRIRSSHRSPASSRAAGGQPRGALRGPRRRRRRSG